MGEVAAEQLAIERRACRGGNETEGGVVVEVGDQAEHGEDGRYVRAREDVGGGRRRRQLGLLQPVPHVAADLGWGYGEG